MNHPACSVVIPTRNCLEYLPIALSSVAAQSGVEIEIIVVDDGSSDGTAAWLKRQSLDWPNLRVVETGGVGVARARNAALPVASAPLIAFLDADDWWWPNKLAAQIAYHAAQPQTAFSFTDYLHVSIEGESRGSCFDYWHSPLRKRKSNAYAELDAAVSAILATNIVGTSTVVAEKALLERAGGFSDVVSAEDWDLWLRLAMQHPVACSKTITATYIMRPDSATSKREARIEAMSAIIEPYERSPSPTIRKAASTARARLDIARAVCERSAGRYTSAARYHSRAFLSLPSARLGKEATASLLNAALHLVGGTK